MGELAFRAHREHLERPWEWKREQTEQVIKAALLAARRPAVAFSGGLHSCLLLQEVRRLNPDVLVYNINLRLSFPEQAAWMEEFILREKLNYRRVDIPEWTDDDGFLAKGIVFKGLQHVPRREWNRFHINAACRGVRQKWERHFLRSQGIDYVFTGLLADEKPPRMKWWLSDGYVKKKWDGCYNVKPIAHWTMDDCQREAEEGRVDYPVVIYDDAGTFRSGDLGCACCSVRLRKKDGGNLGFVYRNCPDLWEKFMFEHGWAEQLKQIQKEYPNSDVQRFIDEFLS
jgi:3'-phosphoadenosine 5'-phosphosulfate sulfotransferase (PAPS reductase)/FAD synthetase